MCYVRESTPPDKKDAMGTSAIFLQLIDSAMSLFNKFKSKSLESTKSLALQYFSSFVYE